MNVTIDGVEYVPANARADSVSIHGMFDCHLFERFTGKSVDELIDNYLEFIKEDTMGTFAGSDKVHNIGVPDLCPAIVMSGEKELRRVGPMVGARSYKCGGKLDKKALEEYRAALKADPDIPRLLLAAEHPPAPEVSLELRCSAKL